MRAIGLNGTVMRRKLYYVLGALLIIAFLGTAWVLRPGSRVVEYSSCVIARVAIPRKYRTVTTDRLPDDLFAERSRERGIRISVTRIEEADSKAKLTSSYIIREYMNPLADIVTELKIRGIQWDIFLNLGEDFFAIAEPNGWRVVVVGIDDWRLEGVTAFLEGIEWNDSMLRNGLVDAQRSARGTNNANGEQAE